jgi:hypothetical protein
MHLSPDVREWLLTTDPMRDPFGIRQRQLERLVAELEHEPDPRMLGGPGSGNPDQPRDDQGQWTSSGGTASTPPGILDAINQADGGFTYHAVTGTQPKTGFVLSLHKDREQVLDVKDIDVVELATYAAKNRDLLGQTDNYLGGWHNPANGKVYLDVSTVVQSATDAEHLARAAQQEAYFDLQTGTSVPIDYGQQALVKAAQTYLESHGFFERPTHISRPHRAREAINGGGPHTRTDRTRAGDPRARIVTAGGPGSGHFGHAGRPGEIGGSSSSGTLNGTPDDPSDSVHIETAEQGGTWNVSHFRDSNTDVTFTNERHAYFHPMAEFDDSNLAGVSGTQVFGELTLKHPKVMSWRETSELNATSIAQLKEEGYDGAIDDHGQEIIAFYPQKQLKETSRKVDSYLSALARREGPLHKIADAHQATLSVAVRYAFAMARKALRPDVRNTDRAVAAMKTALKATLPKTLKQVLVAGGDLTFATLPKIRVAGFNPDQPRDDQGQWVAYHGTSAEKANKILKEGLKLDRFGEIWTTKDLLEAKTYARSAGGDNSVVLELRVPPQDKTRYDARKSFETIRVYTEPLPATYIKKHSEYVKGGWKALAFNPDQPRDERGQWTESGWTAEKGGVLYHGTSESPTKTAVWGHIEDRPMFLTTNDEEAASYARQVHRFGAVPSRDAHIIEFDVKPGKEIDVNDVVSEALDRGDDPETAAIDAAKKAHADFAVYDHPSGVVGKTTDQRVVVVVNPRKSLSYKRAKTTTGRALELRTAKDVPRPLKLRFDVANPNAVNWADRHAAELITQISETTREDINNAIAEALEHGTLGDAYDTILEAVGSAARAELIARHEVMQAASEGQRQAWDQAVEAGLLTGDERRTWIAVGDEKVCPTCEALDGTTAPLGGEYEDGTTGPPAHVACRCTEGLG